MLGLKLNYVSRRGPWSNKQNLNVQDFNSLAPGNFEWNLRHVIFKQILGEIALIWMSLDWKSVNTGSGNGLVPWGNKPLPELMLNQTLCPI